MLVISKSASHCGNLAITCPITPWIVLHSKATGIEVDTMIVLEREDYCAHLNKT